MKIVCNLIFSLLVLVSLSSCKSPLGVTIPAPIYVDNHYHGPADPEVIYNPKTKEWMIFYTARRPFKDQASYVGTPIGVAVSKDFAHWKFAGYCSFDGVGGEPDSEKTYWAPGVVVEGDSAHMYVTLKDDSTPVWGGPSNIVHFSAPLDNLIAGWKRVNTVVHTPIAIDATIVKSGNRWDMWYRDRPTEDTGGLYHAQSNDLYSWTLKGLAKGDINDVKVTKHVYQEGAFAFQWNGYFWIISDPHKGLAVYRSKDAENWEYQGIIMYEPGTRFFDDTRARHPSVIIRDNRAFLVYHVQPFLGYDPGTHEAGDEIHQKFSFLQMAELEYENGKLRCSRNKTLEIPYAPRSGHEENTFRNPVVNYSLPDPTLIKGEDGYFYLYATEDIHNLPIHRSKDLVNWELVGTAFTEESRPAFEPKGNLWAPDINKIGDKYVLYYSMSRWGGEWTCGIGVAMADKPEGPFVDKGMMFRSNEIKVQNSIDPFYIEDKGKKYLFWGSFRGLYTIELTEDGLAIKSGAEKRQIAGTAYEGAYIHKKKGFYYLFASTGTCCEGLKSTYQTVVGRSKKLFGPYVDKQGKAMLENHHEVLIRKNDSFVGNGHNSEIVTDKAGIDWMLYHGVSVTNPHGRVLLLDKVEWKDGWPVIQGNSPSIESKSPVF